MKTLKYAMGAACALFPLFVWSQNRLEVAGQQVERNRKQVTVRFTVESREGVPARDYKTVLSPYLFADGDTLYLTPVEISGHRRMLRERQESLLRGDDAAASELFRGEAGSSLDYSCTVPYERWMKQVSLGIGQHCVGCGKSTPLGRVVELSDVTLYETPEPVMSLEARRAPVLKEANRRWLFSTRHGGPLRGGQRLHRYRSLRQCRDAR